MSQHGFGAFFAALAAKIGETVRKDSPSISSPALTPEDKKIIADLNQFARTGEASPAMLEHAMDTLTKLTGNMSDMLGGCGKNMPWGPTARRAITLVTLSIGLHRAALSAPQRLRNNKIQSLLHRMGARRVAELIGIPDRLCLPRTNMWWDVR